MMTTRRALALELGTIATVLAMFFSPSVFGFANAGTAAWSTWIAAALMLFFGAANAYGRAIWAPWALFVVGLWTLIAPIMLGFHWHAAPFWVHVIGGLLAMAGGWATINWIGTSDLEAR